MRAPVSALLVAIALTAAAVPRAEAISRSSANGVAVRALLSEMRGKPEFILHGTRVPLPRGTRVAFARLSARGGVVSGSRRLAAGRWLFLFDPDPAALFPRRRAMTMLLVSNRTGRITTRWRLRTPPLVNRGLPVFLRTYRAYWGARYRVRLRSATPRSARAGQPHARPAQESPTRQRVRQRLREEKDCAITMADGFTVMGALARGAAAERDFFTGLGVRSRPIGGGFAELAAAVRDDVDNQDCDDVFIYLSGHGYPAQPYRLPDGTVEPADNAGLTTNGISSPKGRVYADELADLIKSLAGKATFKVKVDSCFSGRFKQVFEQKGLTNLVILMTSSGPGELSYGPREPREHNPFALPEYTNGELGALARLVENAGEVANAEKARSFLGYLLRRAHQQSGNPQNGRYDNAQTPDTTIPPRQGPLTHPEVSPATEPPPREQ